MCEASALSLKWVWTGTVWKALQLYLTALHIYPLRDGFFKKSNTRALRGDLHFKSVKNTHCIIPTSCLKSFEGWLLYVGSMQFWVVRCEAGLPNQACINSQRFQWLYQLIIYSPRCHNTATYTMRLAFVWQRLKRLIDLGPWHIGYNFKVNAECPLVVFFLWTETCQGLLPRLGITHIVWEWSSSWHLW